MIHDEKRGTDKREDAYRECEEKIFSGYRMIQSSLNDLRILYMEDGDSEMAEKLADVSSAAADTFEMGRYNEVSAGLDVAVWEKDVKRTAQIMKEMLDSVDSIGAFAVSKLYRHLDLRAVGPELTEERRRELLESLEDEAYDYMRGSELWEQLKNGAKR